MNEELYAIEKTTLTAIGDVIREADGGYINNYPPENMPEAIRSNYDKQRQEGHNEGYSEGYNKGRASGYEDGKVDGYINGQKDGYINGQKAEQQITDGIITRSATSYINNRITEIAIGVFRGYSTLQSARFDNITLINATSFHTCSSLVALVIATSSVCILANTNAFTGTPIADGTGFVYVPDELVSSYKTETNWSAVANSIKPISEYTGELI